MQCCSNNDYTSVTTSWCDGVLSPCITWMCPSASLPLPCPSQPLTKVHMMWSASWHSPWFTAYTSSGRPICLACCALSTARLSLVSWWCRSHASHASSSSSPLPHSTSVTSKLGLPTGGQLLGLLSWEPPELGPAPDDPAANAPAAATRLSERPPRGTLRLVRTGGSGRTGLGPDCIASSPNLGRPCPASWGSTSCSLAPSVLLAGATSAGST